MPAPCLYFAPTQRQAQLRRASASRFEDARRHLPALAAVWTAWLWKDHRGALPGKARQGHADMRPCHACSVCSAVREHLGSFYEQGCIELNASDDRGIDVVREKIKERRQDSPQFEPVPERAERAERAESPTSRASRSRRSLSPRASSRCLSFFSLHSWLHTLGHHTG